MFMIYLNSGVVKNANTNNIVTTAKQINALIKKFNTVYENRLQTIMQIAAAAAETIIITSCLKK